MVNQFTTGVNVLKKFEVYYCFPPWTLMRAFCLNTILVLMFLLHLNAHIDGKTFLYFQDLLSWDWFPVIYFDVSIDFLDDGLLKLSHVGCLHGFMLVEVVLVVACSKRYGI